MKVAVCGGTGFLGRPLVSRLVNDGHEVTVISRGHRKGLPAGVSLALWDPAGGQPPDASALECHALINLAGEPIAQRWTAEAKRRIRSSRVDANRLLVEGLRRVSTRPRLLLSASGIGIYGDRGEETLTEVSPPGDDWLAQLCVEWEASAREAENLGMKVVALRMGVVLGKGGGALERMLPFFRLGLGGPIGAGKQYMSWIHIDDLIGLILFALERQDSPAVLNGTSPNPVRNEVLAQSLGSALRRPALLPAPGVALRLFFGEMSQVLLGSQRVIPEAVLKAGFSYEYPHLEVALRNLLA